MVHFKAILWTQRLLEPWMGLIPGKESEIQMSSHNLTAARRTFFWNTRCSRNTGLKNSQILLPFFGESPPRESCDSWEFCSVNLPTISHLKNGVILHQGWVWTLREGKNLLQVSDWNPMNQIVLQSTAWGLKMHWQCAYWRAGSFKYSTEDISYLNQYTCKMFPNNSLLKILWQGKAWFFPPTFVLILPFWQLARRFWCRRCHL